MKQSKKLLSILLALVMLLGSFSVVASAAQQPVTEAAKGNIAYDSIDNAVLTPEQVAYIVLEMLDNDVLSGIDVAIEIASIQVNLTSVNNIFNSLKSIEGIATGFLGKLLLADLSSLNFDAVNDGYSREESGDLQMVYQLLQFLADNSELLSKAVYGLAGSPGIDLGIVDSFVDLGSINDLLSDLPGFLTRMVYDMLIYGSYGYDKDAEELENNLPTTVNTLDKMLDVAVTNLLTKPQKYEYIDGVKTWDMDSVILSDAKLKENGINLDNGDLSIAKNSIFTLLDKALPVAYETFGTVVLNHDLKKIFMEALGADFVEVEKGSAEYNKIIADPDFVKWVLDEYKPESPTTEQQAQIASVKNYFCNAQMWEVDGTWYFRDYVTRETGEIDPETKEPITKKVHRFQRAEAYNADDLYDLVNWDYYFEDGTIEFNTLITTNGSLIGSLNDLLNIILNEALNLEGLNKILVANGEPTVASVNAIWAPGGLDKFNDNLMSLAGILLKNFTFMFFGRNPDYVDLKTLQATADFKNTINTFIKNDDREGLIAYMLLPFLGDALPQLVYSPDMFESGNQIEQVAALLVREFLTDLTPQICGDVNSAFDYDSLIFSDITSANGRQLVKGQSSDYWMNLVLNMGLDLAAVYLDNISNFNVDLNTLATFHTYATEKGVQPWQVVLEEIVEWAVLYVGNGTNSAIKGLEPATFAEKCGFARNVVAYDHTNDKVTDLKNNYNGNAFVILSTALNTLLPLGIVNGCSTANYSLDVEVLFNKIKDEIIPSLDIAALLGLFGRNVDPNGRNFLANENLPVVILDLVNDLLACIINDGSDSPEILRLPAADSNGKINNPLNYAIQQSQLQVTVQKLLNGLNTRKVPLLTSILPVLAVFVSGWGTEQELGSPDIALGDTISTEDGNVTDYTVTIRNGSEGIWRSYMKAENGKVTGSRQQDNQYSYKLVSITATTMNNIGSITSCSLAEANKVIKFGEESSFTFSASGVPELGTVVRFDLVYTVYDETGAELLNGIQFNRTKYCFINNGAQDSDSVKAEVHDGNIVDKSKKWADISAPRYIYISDNAIASLATSTQISMSNPIAEVDATASFTPGSTTAQAGIALKGFSTTVTKNGGSATASMFNTINYTGPVGEDGKIYSFAGNKVAITRPKISLINGVQNAETSFDLNLVVYSGEYKSKLEDLVSDELGQDRQAAYYSTGSVAVPEEYVDETYTNYFGGSIDGAAAWTEYKNALYEGATRVFQRERTTASLKTLDYKTVYERLYKAVNDIKACELSDDEKLAVDNATGKTTPDVAANYVKGVADQYEGLVGAKDYRTYMLYRWNEYYSAVRMAYNLVELSKRAKAPAETQKFPYRDISIAELNEILAMDAYKGYANYVKALLEDLSEEEIARKAEEHANDVRAYANTDISEHAVNSGYIGMAYNRLIKRTDAPVTSYLNKEIQSAKNQIGTTNTAGYSTKSWAAYDNALGKAETAMNSDSQDAIFAAKYALQVARNNLVLAADEADYQELDTLIEQAKAVLANPSNYAQDNAAFGGVLAALGLEVTNSEGETFNLFPGAALEVQATSYSAHDQDEIDDAADELKKALSKVRFQYYNVTDVGGAESNLRTGETDEEGNPVTEKVNTIEYAPESLVSLAKGQLGWGEGTTVAVSLDERYTATDSDNADKLLGTGATITVLQTTASGVQIPMATMKVIVKGDVSGDGVIDVIDCAIAELVKNQHSDLTGVYFEAANLSNTGDGDVAQININDLQAIVAKALA